MDEATRKLGRTTFTDIFPFGPAPTLILACTLLSAVLLLFVGQGEPEADVTIWTFPATHKDAYVNALPSFEEKTGLRGGVRQISGRVLPRKILTSAHVNLPLPDLVELENTVAGSFFRGRQESIPFHEVESMLKKAVNDKGVSLYDRMVTNRFALYTNRGELYGIPHDIHPVMLAYRRDIFDRFHDQILEETGIDFPDGVKTWDDFVRVGRAVSDHKAGRYAIALSDTGVAAFEPLFYQMNGDFFDAEGNLTMDSDLAVELITWLIPLVKGKPEERIAYHAAGGAQFYQGVSDGLILSFICPDWRCSMTEHNLEDLSGKLALMPLPARTPGGRRTSTWGGTMLAIPKQPHLEGEAAQQQKERAWQYARHLYFDVPSQIEQIRKTKTLPAYRDAWLPEILNERYAYWSDQPILSLFAELADDIPPRNGHPYLEMAKSKMAAVLSASSTWYSANRYRSDEPEFDEAFRRHVREVLAEKAKQIRLMMARNPYN